MKSFIQFINEGWSFKGKDYTPGDEEKIFNLLHLSAKDKVSPSSISGDPCFVKNVSGGKAIRFPVSGQNKCKILKDIELRFTTNANMTKIVSNGIDIVGTADNLFLTYNNRDFSYYYKEVEELYNCFSLVVKRIQKYDEISLLDIKDEIEFNKRNFRDSIIADYKENNNKFFGFSMYAPDAKKRYSYVSDSNLLAFRFICAKDSDEAIHPKAMANKKSGVTTLFEDKFVPTPKLITFDKLDTFISDLAYIKYLSISL